MPIVSVIVPCYNYAGYISQSMESILEQTFFDLELIIIDDGSKDGSRDIIENYAHKDSRIIPIFKGMNGGAAAARNAGLKISRGRFIAFCDADDIWERDKLESQLTIFSNYKEYDVVHSDAIIINSKGEQTGKKFSDLHQRGKKLSGDLFYELCLANFINTQTVAMRRECIRTAGYFPEDIRLVEDWVYWLKVSEKHRFFYINRPLALYRIHERSSNLNREALRENRIKAMQEVLKTYPNLRGNIQSKLYYELGVEFLKKGENKEGRELIMQCVKRDFRNVRGWYRLFFGKKF